MQKSRESLVSRAGHDIITNAAGFRRPLSTLFHCISCDRPVHLDRYGGITSKPCVKKENGNKDLVRITNKRTLALLLACNICHGSRCILVEEYII